MSSVTAKPNTSASHGTRDAYINASVKILKSGFSAYLIIVASHLSAMTKLNSQSRSGKQTFRRRPLQDIIRTGKFEEYSFTDDFEVRARELECSSDVVDEL